MYFMWPAEMIVVLTIACFFGGWQLKYTFDKFKKGKCGCNKCGDN